MDKSPSQVDSPNPNNNGNQWSTGKRDAQEEQALGRKKQKIETDALEKQADPANEEQQGGDDHPIALQDTKSAAAAQDADKANQEQQGGDTGPKKSDTNVDPATTKSVAAALDAEKANEEQQGGNTSKEEDDWPNKSDTHVEMVDDPSSNTTPQATGSKTLFMGNLSFAIEEDDVRDFFKDAGEIARIRFAMRGDRFAGYGHVEFTTAEAAQKGLELHGKTLVDRAVRLDLARERVAHEHPPATPKATVSKTLYMGNLSFSIEEGDVKDFFKEVGEIIEVRFGTRYDRFAGFAHVEFATFEAAQEALKLHNKLLVDRRVKLDLSTSGSSRDKSYQKAAAGGGKTVYIKGFNTSDGYESIRRRLEEHFGKCGEISRLSIPKDHETGAPKGVAFMDFAESKGFGRALELSGSQIGGGVITVQEAKSKGDGGGRGGGYRSGGGGRDRGWGWR